jgi:DNA-binding response OmpR family regulator
MAVLNVDDNDPARFLRTSLLQRGGYTVIEAATAEAARRQGSVPDAELVVLDITLPDGSGYDVCAALKEARPALPVIMVSATYRTTQERLDGYAAGADACLMEPVPPEQLLMIVRQFIGHRPDADAQHAAAWIVTDPAGRIQDISAGAAATLNLAIRGARDRLLTMFFSDRTSANQLLRSASNGISASRALTVHPRDRAPQSVIAHVSPIVMPGDTLNWARWALVLRGPATRGRRRPPTIRH